MSKDTKSILTNLYPLVDAALSSTKGKNAYMKYVNDFFAKRDEEIYDSVPCSRILCVEDEMDLLFEVLNIPKSKVQEAIDQTYYAKISNFNPKAALHCFTVTQLCVIRKFILSNSQKERDVSALLLAFSGKFYPSLHYRSYPTNTPVRHVMEYVVNNELSKKYGLANRGSVMGAVQGVCDTWMTAYKSKFKAFMDADAVYLIQQLHSRVGSFIKNIAEAYYKVYDDKDTYMAYTMDSYDSEDYHVSDNDSLRIERITEATMNYITSNGVDYKICQACSDSNISPLEAKAVIESIIMNRENLLKCKELITLMISTYFASGHTKEVTDIAFITYSVSSKPNAKQPEMVRQKEIIEEFLCESGTAYKRRRSRYATRTSYERCVKMYFALMIHDVARKK
jgi:hypothetical protein